ncbi:MAG: hypothetical protein V9G10_04790 [Candidatus Nanopelagicales bacterium]
MPAGQDLADFTTEHQNVGWFDPAAIDGLPMLPPTTAALADIARFDTVAEALAEHRSPVPIMPKPVPADGDITWVLVNAVTGEPL